MKKQLAFEQFNKRSLMNFGGSILTSNPKVKRPVTTKKSMHLVLRSSEARGKQSFLKFDRAVHKIIGKQGKHFGVKVYRIANGGNHLHLVVLPRTRSAYNGFIRSISGLLVRLVLGVQKGRARGLKFWDNRPWTRIVEWGRDFKSTNDYLMQNTLEALGFIPYKPRKGSYPLVT